MRKISLLSEAEFENRKVLGQVVRAQQSKYYWSTDIQRQAHIETIKQRIPGQVVLEIGCSTGGLAADLAPRAAEYHGIDVSPEAVRVAREKAIKNALFGIADGHRLPFDNSTFDCVIVDSLLHHLDLGTILKEVKRVLKPGGYLFFNEPLGTNPFISFYRSRTPSARTADEKPFDRDDLALLDSIFQIVEMRYFGCFCLLSAFIRIKSLRRILTTLDHQISRTRARVFFWQFAGYATKM